MNLQDKIETLGTEAVNLALSSKWEDAMAKNKEILKLDRSNIEALLRMGFAYSQLNDIKRAERCYKKVLRIQPGNKIALQNIQRMKVVKNVTSKSQHKTVNLDPNTFLSVPGSTINATLVNLGQKDVIASVSLGEEVYLKIRRKRIEIRNEDGDYIGALPDDISKRLILFINAGSKYKAYIKEFDGQHIVVFIKEVSKGQKVRNNISFPEDLTRNIDKIEKKFLGDEEDKEIDDISSIEEEKEELPEISESNIEQLADTLLKEKEDYSSLISSASPTDDDEEE